MLALAAAGAFAADRKNRAPISRDVLKVKLPEAEPVTLSNGMTLMVLEDNRMPLAYVRAQMEGTGMIYAPHPGLAELTADLLLAGAGTRSGKQLVEEAERLGATFSSQASAGAETALVDASGLTSRFNDWLALLADVLMRPTFPADDFNILRQRLVVGLRLRRAQASSLAEDLTNRMIFGTHPAGVSYPAPEALAGLKHDMVTTWYRERYAPATTVVSVIGRVRGSSVKSRVEELFGGWKTPAPKITLPPPPQPATQRRIFVIDRPGANQTQISIGGLLFDRRDDGFFPMSILNSVLGSGASSRLFRIMRSEKGYAYDIVSGFGASRFPGYWRVRAGVRADATGDAVATILGEIQKLCDQPVSAFEIDEAKGALIGQYALRLEQPVQVIGYSYLRFRYGFSSDYWDRFPEKMGAVSASEIQALAQKYMNPAVAQIAVVGDAARIRADLAKFGPVEMQTL
jgi:zinc protease